MGTANEQKAPKLPLTPDRISRGESPDDFAIVRWSELQRCFIFQDVTCAGPGEGPDVGRERQEECS
jgi:hypothetical protein